MSHFLQHILEWLGIDQGTQFIWMIMVYLAGFVVYAARNRTHGVVFSVIFVLMGLALFVFLSSEDLAVRWVSVGVLCATVIASFVWYYFRSRAMTRQT